jgi:ribosomal 50S subunit-recycling heat shock protein
MRVDLFLKKVLLFKKRSEAKKMCEDNLVKLNGKQTKPSRQINQGDIITIESIKGIQTYRVLRVPEGNIRKDETDAYYEEIT